MDLKHRYTKMLVNECENNDLLRNQCAYVLATAWHETGAYKWMKEIWGPTGAQRRYEGRKDLGNVVAGDGKKFMGRGFVQITGRRNYTDWSRRLGIDLLKEPDKASDPGIAARIIVTGMQLGTFTGKSLGQYVTLQRSDFINARRVVNGTDKASLIAGYAEEFDALLKKDGYGFDDGKVVKREEPIVRSEPEEEPEKETGSKGEEPKRMGFWEWLISLFRGRKGN